LQNRSDKVRKIFFSQEKKKRIKIRDYQRKAIIAEEKNFIFLLGERNEVVTTLSQYAIYPETKSHYFIFYLRTIG